jgi:hypothetical protein
MIPAPLSWVDYAEEIIRNREMDKNQEAIGKLERLRHEGKRFEDLDDESSALPCEEQNVTVANSYGEVVIHYEVNGVRKSIVAGLEDYSWLISKYEMDKSWDRVRKLAVDYENGTPEISLKECASIALI